MYVEEFKRALDSVIASCSLLSEAWEKLDESSPKILAKYPFDKDFREVIGVRVSGSGVNSAAWS
ncbi:hypothetical protein [Alicyclobacillus tolerans]|uniref:Uncharacterized protein n=1 Tax=Alicyclobacillus tolerans TaxID=90970 RepID=A0A1M6YAL0_9BACL|nr:hypothetical protein [Alicyclobacillus montanus]SHL15326.1 hypothetical protein SAMN05443507_1472 [Alicyclobacillus montanus]